LPKFQDNAGREWRVRITPDVVRRARAELDLDLANVGASGAFDRLSADPILLIDAVWLAIADDAATLGVTQEQFAASMSGDALEYCGIALADAVAESVPVKYRTAIRDLWQLTTDLDLDRLYLLRLKILSFNPHATR
jgi:hypothetical protein